MNNNLIKIAAEAMKISEEKAVENYKQIENSNAYYFWNPVRGGIAVIVNEDGEKLSATSAISFQKHWDAFQSGKRN